MAFLDQAYMGFTGATLQAKQKHVLLQPAAHFDLSHIPACARILDWPGVWSVWQEGKAHINLSSVPLLKPVTSSPHVRTWKDGNTPSAVSRVQTCYWTVTWWGMALFIIPVDAERPPHHPPSTPRRLWKVWWIWLKAEVTTHLDCGGSENLCFHSDQAS